MTDSASTPTTPPHEPDVEYAPVCTVCWKFVVRNETDDGWTHV